MSLKYAPFLVLMTAALAGCHSNRHMAKETPPPPQDVTPGSTFTVVKDFLVPAGDSSVFFQGYRLYPQGDIQPNYPYCEFATGAASAAGQVIRNKVFRVTDVTYDERAIGLGGTDISISHIQLTDAATGDAYRLNCMLPLLAEGALFVTPVEIQGAVGGYLELKVAP